MALLTSTDGGPRWVTPESLNVSPDLLGLPLATPRQRALAMAVDLGLLFAMGQTGPFGLLAFALALWWRWKWPRLAPRARRLRMIALLVLAALCITGEWATWDYRSRATSAQVSAEQDEDRSDAAELAAAPASGASGPQTCEVRCADAERAWADRVQRLETELEAARKTQELNPNKILMHALNVFDFLWAMAYFSLWPTLWRGQTPGKRLLGIQVRELTGKELTPMLCMKRYGGYAASLATSLLGFLQILWDPNRQGLHDKAAHTVVIDRRGTARTPEPALPTLPQAANDPQVSV